MLLRILGALLVALNLASAQNLNVDLLTESILKERLERGVAKQNARQATIRGIFADAGCAAEEQAVDKKNGNVICTLPGTTDSTVVVGGHFDFIDSGAGIVDDWSGTSLLPSLYQSLKNVLRAHTYIFVAFTKEENGLVGSTHYVVKLPKVERARIKAFINLECLGLTGPKVWLSRATPDLVVKLNAVARSLDIDLQAVNIENVGDDDSHPFYNAKIPVITIHSVMQENFAILHSPRDRVASIRMADYYTAYKLAAYYLAYLDLKLN